MYRPIAWSKAKRWLYEPPNKTEIVMQGHPNSWWESAIEARHEGVKRELKESNAELLEALELMLETVPPYKENGTCTIPDRTIQVVNQAITKAQGKSNNE